MSAVATAALVAACATTRPSPRPDPGAIVFPAPPEAPRIQFLTRYSGAIDVAPPRASFWARMLGKPREEPLSIVKPYGIAIHHGRIYVCDTQLAGVDVIDLPRRTFEQLRPTGAGQLRKPINCFVDAEDGRLYVADAERGQIVRFDSTGRYLDAFGPDSGMRPADVVVRGERVWVADIGTRSIRAYDKRTLRLVLRFPSAAGGALPPSGAVFQPANLFVTDSRVYVSDMGDFRVKSFTLDGKPLASLGSQGMRPGQFVRPKGIAADRDGNLYVVDAAFENVQLFDSTGHLLLFFGGSYHGPGDMWLPAKVVVDYDNLRYFDRYVDSRFVLRYLILVTNQYGPDKVGVYGFVEPRATPAPAR